jgi:hypothetical protein
MRMLLLKAERLPTALWAFVYVPPKSIFKSSSFAPARSKKATVFTISHGYGMVHPDFPDSNAFRTSDKKKAVPR